MPWPARLWSLVEEATEVWQRLGAPEWHRFGLTATPAEQRVWFDQPDSPYQWPLDCDGQP